MKHVSVFMVAILIIAGCGNGKSTELSSNSSYQRNALIVEFHKDISKREIYKVVKRLDVTYIRFLNSRPEDGNMALVKSISATKLKKLLEAEPIVKSVEFNYRRKALRKK